MSFGDQLLTPEKRMHYGDERTAMVAVVVYNAD